MPVLKEIESQIEILPRVNSWLSDADLSEVIHLFSKARSIAYIGCGSSYYIGMAASKYTTGVLRKESRAITGGEIMKSLEWNIANFDGLLAVVISRSGETTEAVESAKIFRDLGVKTVGLTLEGESSLVENTYVPIVLPLKEESIVMTSSFSSMLLTLQRIVERAAGMDKESIYEELLEYLENDFENIRKLAKENSKYGHYVFLGTGPYEGIARESALKLEEMSLTFTEAYATLDYRHGPKSLVDENTLVVIFSRSEDDEKLSREISSLGGKVIMRKNISPAYEDSFVQVVFSQLLGYEISIAKGLDVEKPRNLTKVVKLDG